MSLPYSNNTTILCTSAQTRTYNTMDTYSSMHNTYCTCINRKWTTLKQPWGALKFTTLCSQGMHHVHIRTVYMCQQRGI